jgi:hypothetical protein
VCATCLRGYFMNDYVALCPAPKVLDYLIQYLEDTPEESWLSVLEVRCFGSSDVGESLT